jgi:thymidine phosphorylase
MNQVLGHTAGNAVEVREAIDSLRGEGTEPRLREVTLALSAELLRLGDLEEDLGAGRAAAERALDGGGAAERFAAMAAELGGPADLLEHPERHLPHAPVVRPVDAAVGGVITAVDVRAVGIAIIGLGGGRARETDAIDHSVGFTEIAGVGERVGRGQRPLAVVHARTEAEAERAAAELRDAFTLGETAPAPAGPVIELVR